MEWWQILLLVVGGALFYSFMVGLTLALIPTEPKEDGSWFSNPCADTTFASWWPFFLSWWLGMRLVHWLGRKKAYKYKGDSGGW